VINPVVRKDKKTLVYTVNLEHYDTLFMAPSIDSEYIDFICFHDWIKGSDEIRKRWRLMNVDELSFLNIDNLVRDSSFLLSRYLKIMIPLLVDGYDTYVYADGNVVLKKEFFELVDIFINSGHDIAHISHPARRHVKDEVRFILESNKLDELSKLKFNESYVYFVKEHESLNQVDLTENNLFVVNNSLNAKNYLKQWWSVTEMMPYRDQITSAMARVLADFKIYFFRIESREDNKYFRIVGHRSGDILDVHNYFYGYEVNSRLHKMIYPLVKYFHSLVVKIKNA